MRILPALLLLGHALAAGATTVADLCTPAGAPIDRNKPCACTASPAKCRFTGMATVTSPSTLDFGTNALELAPSAKFDAGVRGVLMVKAASVDLQGGSGFLAPGGEITVESPGNISVRRNGTTRARITVNGTESSRLTITSFGGDVLVEGDLDAGTTVMSDQFAGDVSVRARNITITGDIDISASAKGVAGTLSLQADEIAGAGGDIVLSNSCNIRANSGDDFSVTIDLLAGGNVNTDCDMQLRALDGGGSGGNLEVLATGWIRLGGRVVATGVSSLDFSGGSGDIAATAGDKITVAGLLDVSGPSPAGDAGTVTLTADGDIEQEATPDALINCQGPFSGISGGDASLSAGRALTLGNIDCGGGSAASAGTVDAEARCVLTVPKTRVIDARGPDGGISLSSGGTMTIAGALRSALNELRYYDTPPVTAGAFIDAPPTVRQVPSLPNCGPPAVCGNGKVEPGEACDDGNQVTCDGCQPDCRRVTCGDGRIECGEQADDGNNTSCDGVSSDCRPEGCGNGIRECGEACDAGPSGSDTCNPDCTRKALPSCGNGTIDNGEVCDDGNKVDCDGCSQFCDVDGCGSGTVEAACGEQCDDLNKTPGDGCSATCQIEACGNGVVDAGEECDAGGQNGQLGAPCSATCERAFCGNGVQDAGEACDDANRNECDGCSSACSVPATPCPVCTTGGPEQCVRCADAVDCDPLRACGSAACLQGVCTPVKPPNCNDGNACTTDRCDPARGCVSAPVQCGDDNTCNGLETCDPATGQCRGGEAVSCDDQDECTDDVPSSSAAGCQCANPPKPGLAQCRLSALQRLIDAPGISNATRRKLRKQVGAIVRRLSAASGTGKKAAKAKKQVTNALKALTTTVSKARAKMPSETFTLLDAAVTRVTTAVGGL